MSSYVPTSTITTPAVSVTMPNLSYSQLRQSLGSYVFYVYKVYLNATTYNQITGAIQYNKYDANGSQTFRYLTPAIDPNQYQPALYYDVPFNNMIVDGNNTVEFLLYPSSTMQMLLIAEKTDVGSIGGLSANNFASLISAMGDFTFFKDYSIKSGGDTINFEEINFSIQNNTNAYIPFSFLGNVTNINDISNQTRQTSWDITGILISSNTIITVQYAPINSNQLVTKSIFFTGNNFNDIVKALNTIGVSTFFYLNSGGNDYIKTYNDGYKFGSLTFSAGFNVSLLYNIDNIVAGGVDTIIYVNAVPQFDQPNPYTTGGLSYLLPANGGDTLRVTGTSPVAASSGIAIVVDVTTNTTLYSQNLGSNTPFDFSWVAVANHQYQFTCNQS